MSKPDILSQRRLDAREVAQRVEFRNKTDSPAKPGWYFGRPNDRGGTRISPIFVDRDAHGLFIWLPWASIPSRLNEFDWFGPVMEVREG